MDALRLSPPYTWAAGHGSTTPWPLSTKVPRKTPTPPCSRSSLPSIGLDPSRFSPRAHAGLRCPRQPTLNSSSSTYPPIYLDGTPNAASLSSAASPAGPPTTPPTCPSNYHQTSQSKCSTPSPPSPLPSTSPSKTSHHRRNASKLNRSRATNSFATVAGLSRSYTKPIGSDCLALPGSGESTSNTPDATSSSTGLAPQQNTAGQTVSTDRCASVPRNASYRVLKAKASSPPATPSFPAISGFAPSAPLYFGTKLAMAYGGWARLPIAFLRTLLGQHLHHPVPRRPWTGQDPPPAGELHNLQRRHLRIVVFTTPQGWEPSSRGITQF